MDTIASYAGAVVPIPLVQVTTLAAHFDGEPVATTCSVSATISPSCSPAADRPLHRLREIRQREGVTRGTVARLLGVSAREVERQEQPSSDIPLSTVRRWQKVLGVPLVELLDDSDNELSAPVQLRARLLRIMKTVRSIQERAQHGAIHRLAETLAEQLIEVMPELKDTAAWPTVGQWRKEREPGQAYFRGHSLGAFDGLEWEDE
jgi:transcriptional regulator with XRE-family HTH domain